MTDHDFSRCRPVQHHQQHHHVQHQQQHHQVRHQNIVGKMKGVESTETSVVSDQSISRPGVSESSVLGSDSCVRKGVMWVQQEKMFSRWKERFIILTNTHLHIFKKSTSRISDMGTFVNKVSHHNLKQDQSITTNILDSTE